MHTIVFPLNYSRSSSLTHNEQISIVIVFILGYLDAMNGKLFYVVSVHEMERPRFRIAFAFEKITNGLLNNRMCRNAI